MTLRDFKAFLYLTLKTKLETQQAQSVGMGLAIASVISEEAGKAASDLNSKISEQVVLLDGEFKELYGDPAGSQQDVGIVGDEAPAVMTAPPKTKEQEAFEKAEKTWKVLQKLDAGFAKITGRPTNAPWASFNQSNLSMVEHSAMTKQIDAGKGGLRSVLRSRGIEV